MRRFLILIAYGTPELSFLVGCSRPREITSNVVATKEQEPAEGPSIAGPVEKEDEVFVFRGKYSQTKGPCLQIGDALVMPAVDAFEVVEVVKGNLKAKLVIVSAFSGGGSGYPKELTEGREYILRLAPSERTTQKLRENEKEGNWSVVVDGVEIKEQKVGN
jgi:hypothetical protein